MHASPTFAGFGFGAIQSGLFLAEAFATGRFKRLVVAEVNPERVDAIRGNGGAFSGNVALADKRVTQEIRRCFGSCCRGTNHTDSRNFPCILA